MARTGGHVLPRKETERHRIEKEIEQFLLDEGPHTREEIADFIGRKLGTTSEILNNMKFAGTIKREKLRPDKPLYWMIATD